MVQPATLPPLVRGEWFPMTWEEFLEWSPSEGQAEWVDGEGIAYVSNSARHGRMVRLVGTLVDTYVRVFALGEVFFEQMLMRLPARPSGRMPDLFVVASGDRERVLERWFEGPALFAVEFLSDDSVERDTREKRDEYERAGVPEYLIVEARIGHQGLTYLRLDAAGRYQAVEPDADGRYHSAVLPGFWLDPAWLEQEPPPNVERLMLRIAPEAYRRYMERILAESPD